jgi:hypothetical protein
MAITIDEYKRKRRQGLTQEQILAESRTAPAASSPQAERQPPGSTPISRGVSDFGVGAIKGIASSIKGGINLVGRGLEAIAPAPKAGKLFGQRVAGETVMQSADAALPQKLTTPSNPTQKVGFATEQVAEFFLPGGITKAARASLKLSTAPDILKIIARGALGAAEGAAVTAVQGGTGEQVGDAARTGAAFDVVPGGTSKLLKSKAGKAVTSWLTEAIPSRLVNSILRPSEKAFSFGRNPGLGVVDEGIVANTRGDLLMKIGDQKRRIGEAIGERIAAADEAGSTLDWLGTLKPLDDALEHATKTGQRDLVRQLLDLRDGLTQEYRLIGRELVETGSKPANVSASKLQEMKIELGQSTRWTGQAYDNDLNKVRVAIYRNMDELLDGSVNGIEELNARYANMLTAEKALEKTNNQLQKLVMAGLKVSGFGGLAASTSYLSGDSSTEALGKGIAAGAITKFLGSTPVKTRFAQYLNGLSPKERESLFQAMPALRNVVLGLREKGDDAGDDTDTNE